MILKKTNYAWSDVESINIQKRTKLTCLLSLESLVISESDVFKCWCSRVWFSATSGCYSSSNPKINLWLTFLQIFYQVFRFSCASDAFIYVHNLVYFNLWYCTLEHILTYPWYEVRKLSLNLIVQRVRFINSLYVLFRLIKFIFKRIS